MTTRYAYNSQWHATQQLSFVLVGDAGEDFYFPTRSQLDASDAERLGMKLEQFTIYALFTAIKTYKLVVLTAVIAEVKSR